MQVQECRLERLAAFLLMNNIHAGLRALMELINRLLKNIHYIFIDDLVNAFLLAGISPNAVGQVFHIGSGEGTKFIEMVDTLVKVVNKGKRVNIPWHENYRNIETGDHISDISKAKELLGWKPKISLEEGIKITFEFYDRFGKHYF